MFSTHPRRTLVVALATESWWVLPIAVLWAMIRFTATSPDRVPPAPARGTR